MADNAATLAAEISAVRPRDYALWPFCFSFGLQRHSFYVLRAISVFYFRSFTRDDDTAQLLHSYFFAALSLAPVCVGAFVRTLPAQRRAVYLGEALLAGACALLAIDISRYLAAALLIAGVGLFNVSFKTVFAASLKQRGADLDAGFTWLYLSVNLGSFFAPLLFTRPDRSAFAWCVASMLLSLAFWWMAMRGEELLLDSSPLDRARHALAARRPASRSIFGVLILILFSILFWLGFELKSGRLNLEAANPAVMRQTLFGLGFSGTRLQAVNPAAVMLLGFVFASLWQALAHRGREPHPVAKMSMGLVCLGTGFLVLQFGLSFSHGQPVSPAWFIGLYIWHSIGEWCFEPIGQGFVLANSPEKARAFLLALWESTGAVAFIGGAQASHLLQGNLYLVIGTAAVCAGVLLMALLPVLKQLLKER
ncbi:MAG TPA: hypothetical protein VG672_13915 [Bryobacteraceae bacterium]|jgi:POT family proton-dependent oligopeptide transporter|nr:hypothetical protein [Bryobacteraceae bacterium]